MKIREINPDNEKDIQTITSTGYVGIGYNQTRKEMRFAGIR